MFRRLIFVALFGIVSLSSVSRAKAQTPPVSADTASYLLGVSSEATPGATLTYSITITNFGPGTVKSFYILDGWTVNTEGISAFASPIPEPDFGSFTVVGSWQQARPDQKVFAWLLSGEFAPGKTAQFDWKGHVSSTYTGTLINWSKIQIFGALSGIWEPRILATTAPPAVADAIDPDEKNNRTADGITLVSDNPTQQGVDMAIYQTGLVKQLKTGNPLTSTFFVTNLGPQSVKHFYLEAAWSVDTDGKSVLKPPVSAPDFGDLHILGSWQSLTTDEERWLWLVEGELKQRQRVALPWTRSVAATYT